MAIKNAFYAQSGGVTAVINASACGVIQTARKHPDQIGKVYAGRNGIIGALKEELIDTSLESDDAIQALIAEDLAHGFAHVTGGGLVGNTSRIVPDGLALDVDWDAWTVPPLFRLIQDVGEVPEEDMRRTFNLGVGLVAVVRPDAVERALTVLGALGEPAFAIGSVVAA